MKKRIVSILLVLAMCFSLVACGGNTEDTTEATPQLIPSNIYTHQQLRLNWILNLKVPAFL